jgi:hypothetical protein
MTGDALVAQGQPPVARQPGHGALDDPAVPSELVAGLGSLAGDADGDATVADPGAQLSVVVGLAGVQLAGLRRRGPRRERMAGMALTSGLRAKESLTLAADSATDSGRPAASDKAWIFEPGFPGPPGWGRSGCPFFSADAGGVHDHAGPVDEALAAQLVQHGPVQPGPDPGLCPLAEPAVGTPNEGGRSRQAHPLVSTYTIAVKTWRSGSGAVPPPCGRGWNWGRCGWTSSHSSSGTSRDDS